MIERLRQLSFRRVVYGAIAAVLGLLGATAWALRARKAKLDRETRKNLDESLIEVGRLNERARVVKMKLGEHHMASADIERKLDLAKRAAVQALVKPKREMDRDEIRSAFKKLGL